MAFRVSVLASGSSGNAVYVQAGNKRFLFDAGIPMRETERRMEQIGADPAKLDGIFLSHEHADHVRGAGPLHRKYGMPLFGTGGTLGGSRGALGDVFDGHALTGRLVELDTLSFGGTEVMPVRVPHDALDPTGFVVDHGGKRLSIFTDLGRGISAVREALSSSDAAVLESNHCIDLLWNGPYPPHLKQRIASPHGHLSNEEAASLLMDAEPDSLRAVFLAHRSLTNNTAGRAYALLDHARSSLGNGMALVHTSRCGPTGLVRVGRLLSREEEREAQPDLSAEGRWRGNRTLNKYCE